MFAQWGLYNTAHALHNLRARGVCMIPALAQDLNNGKYFKYIIGARIPTSTPFRWSFTGEESNQDQNRAINTGENHPFWHPSCGLLSLRSPALDRLDYLDRHLSDVSDTICQLALSLARFHTTVIEDRRTKNQEDGFATYIDDLLIVVDRLDSLDRLDETQIVISRMGATHFVNSLSLARF